MPMIELQRRIRWADADAAGRLYFPRIFDYVSEAETEIFRMLGINMSNYSEYGFPRKHAEAAFHRILALDAPFTLRVTVGKLGHSSIRYEFQAFADEACTELAFDGSMTVVVVKDGKPHEIPAELRARLS
ncbi:MAG: acyl-CoA thioesterase [Acidobacteria bacterium]|nr:acyl-CoA thioesterase [Acidobacteriota bacterium]MBI3427699.1 acyl-CoA thioesterase [Acidobacteriota bacterium]